jgi:hypothetical protein
MKTKTLIAIAIMLPLSAWAATLTIEVPTEDIPRLTEAYGSILNFGRPATQPEIELAIKQWLVGSTKDFERRKNMAAYTPPPFSTEPTPTPTPGAVAAAAPKAAPSPTATPKKKK